MTVTCTRHSLRPCLCPECSGSLKQATDQPAHLSPDVAELVRLVRQVDYAEDATSFHKMTDEQLKELIANCKAAKEMK